jgi:hypothetical protein
MDANNNAWNRKSQQLSLKQLLTLDIYSTLTEWLVKSFFSYFCWIQLSGDPQPVPGIAGRISWRLTDA